MPWLFLAVAIVVGVVVYRLWRRHTRPQRLFATLCQMTRDEAVADRLVDGEQRRHPELSEEACIARAIQQLRHDRRR